MSIKSVILVRADRMGDLVLSLSLDEHPVLQKAKKIWLISPGFSEITKARVEQDQRVYFEIKRAFSWKNFWRLFIELKKEKPELSILMEGPWWVSALLWLARVKTRIAPRAKWHHVLFHNRSIKQKRSRSVKHEAEYNFDLLKEGLELEQDTFNKAAQLDVSENFSSEFLKKWSLPKDYLVIHPGMMGSARNWPENYYNDLIESLLKQNKKILITGTKSDSKYLEKIKSRWQDQAGVFWLVEKLNLKELLTVLKSAQVVLAPSTGVLHLAASLGTRSVGLYAPIKVQGPWRWGPRGKSVQVFVPNVECPAHFKCLGEACPSFDCMKQIKSQEVATQMLNFNTKESHEPVG